MAEWCTVGSDKQEEAALHNHSSADFYVVGNDKKDSPRRFGPQAPSKTGSNTAHGSKKRTLCVVFVIAAVVVVVACAVAVTIALIRKGRSGKSDSNSSSVRPLTAACEITLYPTVCINSLGNVSSTGDSSPQQMVKLSLQAATDNLTREFTKAQDLFENTSSGAVKAAFQDCVEFIQDSLDSLEDTLESLNALDRNNLDDTLSDMESWMSASITTQDTCLDGFDDLDPTTLSGPQADFMEQGRFCSMMLSNVLAFVSALRDVAGNIPKIPGHRRLLTSNQSIATLLTRRLLATSRSNATLTVAQDGSGDYRRIQDAVNKVPQTTSDAMSQFVIYIKSGKYVENVLVPKKANNVVFWGDGIGKTIISGNLSVIGSNVTTSATATLNVQGKNFVGRNFTVENTAGAVNHQAVAVRVNGDYAAFENCQFLGFQDTLYTHTNRQFYLRCTVVGTVDFIFGNAAVVFQNSRILATKGLAGQRNTYTASGRTDPNQNTGITFQNCTFDATDSLKNRTNGTFLTYLGRPWKNYARTVIMQSVESNVLEPAGWLAWNGVTPNSTVYYAEYQNTGPGSGFADRVPWSQQIGQSKAQQFTVDPFIQGSKWLQQANITYISSL